MTSPRLLAGAALAAVLALTACAGPQAAPATSTESASSGGGQSAAINLGLVQGQDFIHAMPARVAEAQGFFADHNVEAKVIDFTSGSDLIKAMAGGSVDVGAATGLDAVAASARGVDLQAFWGIESASPMALIVRADSDVAKFSDLEGKSVGISAAGSMTDYTLRAALDKAGVPLDSVTEVPLGAPSATIEALTRGDIQALVLPVNFGYVVEADGSGKLAQTAADVIGGDDQFAVLLATPDYLGANADAVRNLTAAYTDAINWMTDNKDETVALAVAKLGMTEDIAAQTYDALIDQFTADGALNADGLAAYAKALPDLGIGTSSPAEDAYLNTTFTE